MIYMYVILFVIVNYKEYYRYSVSVYQKVERNTSKLPVTVWNRFSVIVMMTWKTVLREILTGH